MEKQIEEVLSKHFQLLIKELDDKNITGVRFVKKEDRIMLLFDKTLLSKTNQQILNAINVVYPNIIVSINDSENPFDYEELYRQDSEKPNKKVRPSKLEQETYVQKGNTAEYFERFRFAGIELNINEITQKNIQFGYFLEFINVLQEQDVIDYEKLEILDEKISQRHEHYLKNGAPDKRHISLWVTYGEELFEFSNGLRVGNDPYLSKMYIKILNKNDDEPSLQFVKLELKRINQNIKDYLRRNVQGGENILRKQNNDVELIEEK